MAKYMICDNVCNDHVFNSSRLACRSVRQPAGAIWLCIILCDLRVNESPCNCFTLSLRVALVVVTIVGGQPWWRRHNAGGDGDHAGALEMEIKGTRRKGHIIS